MGFEGLLGNRRLKENLRESLSRGRISHFYLISGPAGSGKKTLARLLAAAIVCEKEDKPCLSCPACRKIMANAHPDLITVDDPEHKQVSVKIVRQAREDVFIRPNEASHKIYLFPQELGIEGQNALLKVLEEPPSYGVFLLLTENPDKILTTVRSRCTQLSLQSLPEELLRQQLQRDFPDAPPQTLDAAIARSNGYLGQAAQLLNQGTGISPQTESFLRSRLEGNALLLTQTLVPMERWGRDKLLEELKVWTETLQQALSCRYGSSVLSAEARSLAAVCSPATLLLWINALQKASEYAQGNVSAAAICGYLAWALR